MSTHPADAPAEPARASDRALRGALAREPDPGIWDLTFERSPVGMALVGLDGAWTRVNQSLCAMVGYSPEQLMTMSFQDITHADDLSEDLDLLQACLAGERDGYRMTKRYVHADGHLVWGDLSVALVSDEHGPVHFVSQILDVSEQRADKARLEQVMAELGTVNDALGQFAAVVSHDLKTPLSTIRASLELLVDSLPGADGEPDGPPTPPVGPRALAARAASAAERMSGLIDALLAYTVTDPRLPGSDGSHAGAHRVGLSDVVAAALADVQTMLDRGDVQVHLDPGLATAPEVLASPALVRTLLVNLVSNAIKYREPTRPLTIRIGAEPDPDDERFVRVSVRNDGPPIAPEDRDRLFSLFSRGQADGGPGASVPGFGIGLAACRRIVTWHGGRIWFADPGEPTGPRDQPDRGVAVLFTLPLPG